jgi:hypothetical protein
MWAHSTTWEKAGIYAYFSLDCLTGHAQIMVLLGVDVHCFFKLQRNELQTLSQ